MSEAQQSKKISVGLVLGWIFGILFALTGISFVFSEPVSGIVMLIMAAILLPPINRMVDKKWKFHLSGGIKIILIVIGLIVFGSTVDTSNTTKQKDNQLEVQQEQQQAILEADQSKNELGLTEEEQPNTTNNEQTNETEKTETIPLSNNEPELEPQKSPTKTKSNSETGANIIIENHCQSEWPNDAKMKAYCKEQQYNGLTTLNLNKPSDITESQFSTIRNHCKNEWPTDFKMRAYCEGQQYDGVRTLNNGKPADIGDTEFGIIWSKCENEWPTDFKMRAYCEGQQYDAIRTLNQGKPANVSESVFESARSSCANEWPTDYKMRVYCENQKY